MANSATGPTTHTHLPTAGTTVELPVKDVDSYDFVIVGGGTAGWYVEHVLQ